MCHTVYKTLQPKETLNVDESVAKLRTLRSEPLNPQEGLPEDIGNGANPPFKGNDKYVNQDMQQREPSAQASGGRQSALWVTTQMDGVDVVSSSWQNYYVHGGEN